MVSCALILLAGALLSWPCTAAHRRLWTDHTTVDPPAAPRRGPRTARAVPVAAAALGAVVAGAGGACAALALSVLARWYLREGRRQRDRLAQASAFSQGLRLLVADLRAGAHPATAAAGVAVDAPHEVAGVFRRLAATARLGGDIGTTVTGFAAGPDSVDGHRSAAPVAVRTGGACGFSRNWLRAHAGPRGTRIAGGWTRRWFGPVPARSGHRRASGPEDGGTTVDVPDGVRDSLGRLTRAWALAERHGIALADVLDAVHRDIEHRVTFARDIEARMSGPRATAGVLAALPALSLALGEATGSRSWVVLSGQPLGQLLLVFGVGLICLGVVWTVRLTRTGVRR